MSSICRFLPTKDYDDSIQPVYFVYETEFHKLKQPFVHAVYYVFLVTKGTGTLQILNRSLPLETGTLFVVFPGTVYTQRRPHLYVHQLYGERSGQSPVADLSEHGEDRLSRTGTSDRFLAERDPEDQQRKCQHPDGMRAPLYAFVLSSAYGRGGFKKQPDLRQYPDLCEKPLHGTRSIQSSPSLCLTSKKVSKRAPKR